MFLFLFVFVALLVFILWPNKSHRTRQIEDSPHESEVDIVKQLAIHAPHTGCKYLIVGTGSLGVALVHMLLARGEKRIRVFDIRPPPSLKALAGIEVITGSVVDGDALARACIGIDTVFYTAAVINYHHRLAFQYAQSHAVNVDGAANIVKACCLQNVKMIVYTSSSHVVITPGIGDRLPVDETTPCATPQNSLNHYITTKAKAERIIVDANGRQCADGSVLRTVSLRPGGIFGPRHGMLTAKVLQSRVLYLITPAYYIDWSCAENVAFAHLLAEKKLWEHSDVVAGEVFMIADRNPCNLEDFYWAIQHHAKPYFDIKFRHLPTRLMVLLAYFSEAVQYVFRGRVSLGDLDNFTPPSFQLMQCNLVSDPAKAERLLGYFPLYSLDQGMQRTVRLFHELEKQGIAS